VEYLVKCLVDLNCIFGALAVSAVSKMFCNISVVHAGEKERKKEKNNNNI
jgi:hypothetical protein